MTILEHLEQSQDPEAQRLANQLREAEAHAEEHCTCTAIPDIIYTCSACRKEIEAEHEAERWLFGEVRIPF